VAVVGHRDLHPGDIDAVRERIREVVSLTLAAMPATPVHFLSALADGADQLFAAEVLAMRAEAGAAGSRIRLSVPLPMPLEEYVFEQAGGQRAQQADAAAFALSRAAFAQRFSACADQADQVFVIPQRPLDTRAARVADAASTPYARLARYLNIHAHLAVAIWDGQTAPASRFPREAGGTLDFVLSRLQGFDRVTESRSGRRFAEPDRGRVLHIFSRRARDSSAGLAPARGHIPGACMIGLAPDGGDIASPQESRLDPKGRGVALPRPVQFIASPVQATAGIKARLEWRRLEAAVARATGRTRDAAARVILHEVWQASREIELFNATHRRALHGAGGPAYRESIAQSQGWFLQTLPDAGEGGVPARAGLAPLLRTFSAADVLARRAQGQWRRRWLVIACGAMIAGASSGLKALAPAYGVLIETLAFAFGAVTAILVYLEFTLSSDRDAYLEYRALAEGMRFQMYWLVAGLDTLVTDHYVQKYRDELGWMRRALDACAVIAPVRALPATAVVRGWIADQQSYLTGHENTRRRARHARAARWGNNLLLTGLACGFAGLAAVLAGGASAGTLALLVAGMKLAPAMGAGWLSFNSKMALGETLKQFTQLALVYKRAGEALKEIMTMEHPEDQARDLLLALGKEALAENANWLAIYQQRKISWPVK
jgi:hypothetical protein